MPRRGDNTAEFEALYHSLHREVWALAHARSEDADLAMDVTQEAFLRLWRQWEAGDDIQNPRAWLLRVARNLAEDYAKSAFRRNGTHPPDQLNEVHACETTPAEAAVLSEECAAVRAALATFSEAERNILIMSYEQAASLNQVRKVTGYSRSGLHRRLRRLRDRLRCLLRGWSDADEEIDSPIRSNAPCPRPRSRGTPSGRVEGPAGRSRGPTST